MKRTFVIGDIHGCFDELQQLIQQINLQEEDVIISLGDIIDRGNKSVEVYHYLRNRPNTVVLTGNHERKHLNGILNYAQEIVKLQFGAAYPAFLEWAQHLPYFHETDDAIIVHAAFEHDQPLAAQKEEVLCGATAGERYLEQKYEDAANWVKAYTGTKPIIYGHHVVGDRPQLTNNTWGIDTGCCHHGYLTAIELPGFVIHQVRSAADHWKNEQQQWQLPVLKAKEWQQLEIATIQQQLNKLAYITDTEVRNYLGGIEAWLGTLENNYQVLKDALDAFAAELLAGHAEKFAAAADQHYFKVFLFKSKANNLKLADLAKSLNTPHKIKTLAASLQVTITDFPA